MCGIVGYWKETGSPINSEHIRRMADHLSHRGPDDTGIWTDSHTGLALGHRRLSIIDLSEAGHQPMPSYCGRYVLTYNGEIYNHKDIRKELENTSSLNNWRGHSDTETLLAALIQWGLENTLKRINGMFAFALWDRTEKTLYLARDRIGEKPIYYGRTRGVFLFGSELKALSTHPDWQGDIDRNALALYMRHNYIPAPWSIYEGIYKLPPAHYMTIRNAGTDISEPHCYWHLDDVASSGIAQQSTLRVNDKLLINELDGLLLDAVGRRMEADVPLGAFLSGGYDSTTVVTMMQQQSERPVRTFTIGFHEDQFDEAQHAKAIAKHLGTDHTELYVTSQQAIDVIPDLPTIWDEPFSDSSQIPTLLISQLAKQQVTVSLSGDGGDELFYGYSRYFLVDRIWRYLSILPKGVRRHMSWILMHAPHHMLSQIAQILPTKFRIQHLEDRLPKIADVLQTQSGEAFYRFFISHWKHPESIVLNGTEPDTILSRSDYLPSLPGLRERMMYLDTMIYLPGDILTKLDRASMSVGLEARVPLLDHRLVEFAWQLPMSLKHRDGQGKWALRQVLYKYVPKKLMERPKMGFGVPIEHWLRGPLREWAEELMSEKRLREEGYFNPQPIRKMWEEHISGKRRWHHCLWDVLMFQAWLHKS